MRSLAWVVPRARGEAVRRRLRELEVLRSELEVLDRGEEVAFPIRALPTPAPEWGSADELEFPPRGTAPTRSYRDLLHLAPELQTELPRAFDVVGDIVLVRLPPALESSAPEIGEALLRFVPRARIVGWDRGVEGVARLRRLERIAGTGGWNTMHQENGIGIEVDLGVAYFSPRLAREHGRVAAEVRPGETVHDLCCGVGPFALTIARNAGASGVVAVDQNAEAIGLLKMNRDRLGFAARIRAVHASLDEFLPTGGVAGRAILNLPHEGIKYLTSVVATIAPGGVLHYYEVTERADRPGRHTALEHLAGSPGSWAVAESHVVHPYSPTSDLVAYTLEHRS